MSNTRPRVNDADFFFALPSDLKEAVRQIAIEEGVSEAAAWRSAGRRLIADVKKGRRVTYR